MAAKYMAGQKVIIRPASGQTSSRDSKLEPYAGQIGEIADYRWISPELSKVFYIYTVKVDAGKKEVVLHEDEIEPFIE